MNFIPATTRTSWTIQEMPPEREPLKLSEIYTAEEFERVQHGFLPGQMEDRWFAFYEEPWLYFHRSWTGHCIFAIRFESFDEGFATSESWVNNDPNQYGEKSFGVKQFEAKNLIKMLIEYEAMPYLSENERVLAAGGKEFGQGKTRTDRLYKVLSGELTLEIDGVEKVCRAGEVVSLPASHRCDLMNRGSNPVHFIERIDGVVPDEEENP